MWTQRAHAPQILESVRMIKFAESLGGVETLITYPTTQTHADVPEEVRLKMESRRARSGYLWESRISRTFSRS